MSDFFGIAAIGRATSTLAGRMMAAQRRRRTMRVLESLPPAIRRDIGFPDDRRSSFSDGWPWR